MKTDSLSKFFLTILMLSATSLLGPVAWADHVDAEGAEPNVTCDPDPDARGREEFKTALYKWTASKKLETKNLSFSQYLTQYQAFLKTKPKVSLAAMKAISTQFALLYFDPSISSNDKKIIDDIVHITNVELVGTDFDIPAQKKLLRNK